MRIEGHIALIEQLRGLSGHVLLSGYDCDIYRSMLSGWRRVEASAVRGNGTTATESLWLSPSVVQAHDGRMPLFDEVLQ